MWWRKPRPCRHDKAIDHAFFDEDYPLASLFLDQGWPEESWRQLTFNLTARGTRTLSMPLQLEGDKPLWAVLSLGVINETFIYGVLGIAFEGTVIGSFHHFPEEVALKMQLCPRPEEIMQMWEEVILPHLVNERLLS